MKDNKIRVYKYIGLPRRHSKIDLDMVNLKNVEMIGKNICRIVFSSKQKYIHDDQTLRASCSTSLFDGDEFVSVDLVEFVSEDGSRLDIAISVNDWSLPYIVVTPLKYEYEVLVINTGIGKATPQKNVLYATYKPTKWVGGKDRVYKLKFNHDLN